MAHSMQTIEQERYESQKLIFELTNSIEENTAFMEKIVHLLSSNVKTIESLSEIVTNVREQATILEAPTSRFSM